MTNGSSGGRGGVIIDARNLFTKIRHLQQGARPEPYLRAIGLRIMGWVDQNFRAQGLEQPWPPLSPNTIVNRRKGGAGARTLQDTGRLKMSWTRAGGNPRILGGHTVQVASNIKYAKWHEFGTGPYVIRPKKPGGRLVFRTAGGMVFAREVNHPGLPKRQMAPSERTARRLARETLQAAIDKMVAAARAR